MPVYNAEEYLPESIESILNQTYSNFTFLIIDDGSTDNSNEVIQKYSSDPRIEVISLSDNHGLVYCLNLGLDRIKTEFIVRMDADDVSHTERIEVQVKLMETNPNLQVIGSKVIGYDVAFPKLEELKLELTDQRKINSIAFLNCPIAHPTVIMRRDFLVLKSLKYDLDYKHAEDNALWLDVISEGNISEIQYPFLKYRHHLNQVSNLENRIQELNSAKKRAQLIFKLTSINFSDTELAKYRYLSYKHDTLMLSDFENFSAFVVKFRESVLNQTEIQIDKYFFIKLLYQRVSLLYLRNSKIGTVLLWNYLRNFGMDLNIFIFPRLLRRVIHGL